MVVSGVKEVSEGGCCILQMVGEEPFTLIGFLINAFVLSSKVGGNIDLEWREFSLQSTPFSRAMYG